MPQLTYGGIPLLFDWRQAIAEFQDLNQRIDDTWEFPEAISRHTWQTNPVRSTQRIGLPRYNWPDPPPRRLNQLYWPCTGATRWAFGLFAMDDTNRNLLEQLDCTKAHVLKIETETTPYTESVLGTGTKTFTAVMFHLMPRRLAGCTSNNQLWLIPLVDQRWFWQHANVDDIKSILISQDSSNCTTSCAASWETLLTYLLDQTGATYAYDEIPSAYANGPDCREFCRPWDNLACVLDAAASSVGARVVAMLDGTIRVERPAAAKVKVVQNFNAMVHQTAGSQCDDIDNDYYARNVEVVFPILRCYSPDCDEDSYSILNGTSAECGEIGNTKTIHVPAYADMGCDCDNETPTNLAAMTALAEQIATDYDAYYDLQYDATFSPPQAWQPNGCDDCLIIKAGVEEPDEFDIGSEQDERSADNDPLIWSTIRKQQRRLHQIRIQSFPVTCGTDAQLHWLPATVLQDSVIRFELTEDLCRGDCATAKVLGSCCDGDLSEIGLEVEVCDSAYIICENKFYGGTSTSSGECDVCGACGCVPAGTRGVARFYPDACRFELVNLEMCDENDRYWIEATECIMPGASGSGDLYRRASDGSLELICSNVTVDNTDCMILALPGETFPVEAPDCDAACQWHPSSQFGLTRPVRIYPPTSQGVQCGETVDGIVLTVTSSEVSGETVCEWDESDCTIEVCNTTGRILVCHATREQHMATLDPTTCLWYLHPGDRPVIMSGTLNDKWCENDPSPKIDGANFPGWCDWEEDVANVMNPLKIEGCQGDKVLCVPYYGETGETCEELSWQIIQIEEHRYDMMMDIDYSKTCTGSGEEEQLASCEVRKKVKTLSTHTCECDDGTWETAITLSVIDVVVGANLDADCGTSSAGDEYATLQMKTTKLCVFPQCDGQADAYIDAWTFEATSVVTLLDDDGTCLNATVATIFVPIVCDESVEEIFCTTDCVDSSSS